MRGLAPYIFGALMAFAVGHAATRLHEALFAAAAAPFHQGSLNP